MENYVFLGTNKQTPMNFYCEICEKTLARKDKHLQTKLHLKNLENKLQTGGGLISDPKSECPVCHRMRYNSPDGIKLHEASLSHMKALKALDEGRPIRTSASEAKARYRAKLRASNPEKYKAIISSQKRDKETNKINTQNYRDRVKEALGEETWKVINNASKLAWRQQTKIEKTSTVKDEDKTPPKKDRRKTADRLDISFADLPALFDKLDGVKQTTKKQYSDRAKAYWNKLHGVKGKVKGIIDMKHFRDCDEVKSNILKFWKNSTTQKATFISIASLMSMSDPNGFKDCIAKFNALAGKLNEDWVKEKSTNAPSEKERKNWVKWSEVEAVRDSYPEGSLERVVASLYSLTPPRRGEYCKLLKRDFGDESATFNIFIADRTQNGSRRYSIEFNDHKTSSSQGSYTMSLSPRLGKLLHDYTKKTDNVDYVFLKKNGEPYTTDEWTRLVRKIFSSKLGGKNIGIQMLRKIYVSEFAHKGTWSFKKDLAERMGHSVDTQQGQYLKHQSPEKQVEWLKGLADKPAS